MRDDSRMRDEMRATGTADEQDEKYEAESEMRCDVS